MTTPVGEIVFWTAAALCVVAELAILRFGLRSIRAGRAVGGALEWVWALLPAVALAWVLVATWGEMHKHGAHQMMMDMPSSQS